MILCIYCIYKGIECVAINAIYMVAKKVVIPPFEAIKSIWIVFLCFQWTGIDMKWTCDCCPTKSDLTLAGLPFQCQVGSSQFRWSFPQICLRTVASSNQQLHICSQFSLIVLMMSRSTPIYISSMKCLHLPVRHVPRCYCCLCGSDSCYCQPHLQQACCH